MRAVVELDDEEAKCGNWKRIFPVAHGHTYRRLFAQERPMNSLLVDVLIARRKEPAAPTRRRPTPSAPRPPTPPTPPTTPPPTTRPPRAPPHRQAAHPDAPAVDVVGDVAAVVVVCVVLVVFLREAEAAYKRPGRPTTPGCAARAP